jgi:hypothetical protein
VGVLNPVLTRLFDLALWPLHRLGPLAGLTVLSIVTAIGVLLAFKWTADQSGLVAAKRAMQAAIFEMRLFNDDLAALLRAQGEVVRHTLRYLRHSLAPTLWLMAPMLMLLLHMEFHFGYTGLPIGETALVRADFDSDAAAQGMATPPVSLEASKGVGVETPGVWFPSEREMAWRIRPSAAGSYELRLHMGGAVLTKTLLVSDAVTRRSPVRPGTGLLDQLRYPSEAPLPANSGLTAITIGYPERPYVVAGWNVGWSGVYLALTLAFALALKRPFGVVM